MKKVLSIVLTLSMLLTLFATVTLPPTVVSAASYTVTADPVWDWFYNNNTSAQKVTLKAYKGTDTNLTHDEIPAILDGAWFAANGGCDLSAYETDLVNNTYAVETIQDFYKAAMLNSLELPYGFDSIGDNGFRGQNQLRQLYIPDSVTSLAKNTFMDCAGMDTIVLSANLSYMGGANFYNTKSGVNIYFQTNTAPACGSAALLANTKNANIYYPQGADAQSYKNLYWYGGTQGTVTFNEYTVLPEEAEAYYVAIGRGTTDPNESPTPRPSSSPTPSPTPTPTPSPTPSLTPTPTPTPSPTPTSSSSPTPMPPQVNSIGFGTSFILYPTERAGITVAAEEGFSTNGAGAVLDISTKEVKAGPYTISNAAKFMNSINGATIITVSQGGIIDKSAFGSVYSGYRASVSGTGSTAEYRPKAGLLKGVDTNISFSYYARGNSKNSKGLDAIITYDGGQTRIIEEVVRDGELPGAVNGVVNLPVEISEPVTSLESFVLRTRGSGAVYMPSVQFLVVNDNPGTAAPELPYRKYIQPNINTVTPGLIIPVPTPNTESCLSVNEVLAGNKNGLADKFGEYSDWIEIYNSSDEDIDVSGYGLTDNTEDPYKWLFPGGSTVPAKGYLLVIASGQNTSKDGELHTNYSISKDGETIMLSDPEGGILSVMDLPKMDDDMTMARVPDGGNNLKKMNPSPGSTNSAEVISAYVPRPEFSAESGFYPENFDLTISAPQGVTVYYTLDGSKPDPANIQTPTETPAPSGSPAPNNPAAVPKPVTYVYQSPVTIMNRTNEPNIISMIKYINERIDPRHPDNPVSFLPSVNIDKSMVVRAVAVDSEGNKSDVATKSYFVGFDMKNDFNNTAVLSISTNAEDLFSVDTGIFTNVDMEWEKEVHIDLFESDGRLVIDQDAGTSIRGLGSRIQDQKGMNFYARGIYGAGKFNYPIWGKDAVSKVTGSVIESFDNFCIKSGDTRSNDDARYFDGALQYMSRELDTQWQASRTCVVFINGEYWGQYFIQERVSTDYIAEHYGVPKEDVILVKKDEGKGTATPEEVYAMEKGLTDWLKQTDFTKPENLAALYEKFDMQNMLMYYAANVAAVNRDWVGAGFNFARWRSRTINPDNPYQDGRIRFMMYDLDASYYNFDNDDSLDANLNGDYTLALLVNESLRNIFINAMCDVYSYTYEPNKTMNEMKYWQDEIQPLTPDLEARWGLTKVKDALSLIKVPITGRPPFQYDLLAKFLKTRVPERMNKVPGISNWTWDFSGEYAYLNVKVNDGEGGGVKVNTINPDLTEGKSYTGRYFTDIPSTLTALPKSGYRFTGWIVTEGTEILSEADENITVKIPSYGSVITANFELIPVETKTILTIQDLRDMAEAVNSGGDAARINYILKNNITFNADEKNNFTPIGTATAPFMGTFDGRGFTISGINTELEQQGQGLFGYVGADDVSRGIVRNVGVINCKIVGLNKNGKNIGAVVGNNGGLVENCYSTGLLDGESTVGGIAGNNKGGIVRNCYSIAEIKSRSSGTLSGVVGKTELNGEVINCYSLIIPVAKTETGGTVDNLTSIKSVEEFEDGTVTNLMNENGANVWVQGETGPVLRFTEEAVEIDYYNRLISITGVTDKTEVTAVAASYDENTLTDIAVYPVTISENGNGTATLREDFTAGSNGKIKIMLIDNTDFMSPLCESIVVAK